MLMRRIFNYHLALACAVLLLVLPGGKLLLAATDESEWDTSEPAYCEPEPSCEYGGDNYPPTSCESNIMADIIPAADDPLAFAVGTAPAPACSSIKLTLNLAPPTTYPLHCAVLVAHFGSSGTATWEFKGTLFCTNTSIMPPQTYALGPRADYVNADGEVMYCIVGLALPDPASDGSTGTRHDSAGVHVNGATVTCF